MPKVNISTVPVRERTGYPTELNETCAGSNRRRFGDAGGLEQPNDTSTMEVV